jgi:hypothetical protein
MNQKLQIRATVLSSKGLIPRQGTAGCWRGVGPLMAQSCKPPTSQETNQQLFAAFCSSWLLLLLFLLTPAFGRGSPIAFCNWGGKEGLQAVGLVLRSVTVRFYWECRKGAHFSARDVQSSVLVQALRACFISLDSHWQGCPQFPRPGPHP